MFNKSNILNWLDKRYNQTVESFHSNRSLSFLDVKKYVLEFEGTYEQLLNDTESILLNLNSFTVFLQKEYDESKSEESLQRKKSFGARRCTYNEIYAYLVSHKNIINA